MMPSLDYIGVFIAQMHQLLGHDKAAAYLGQPSYNKQTCVLCLFEQGKATKADVEAQLGI
jgi:hypothetical protein